MDNGASPSNHDLPLRLADFETLSGALDYAAKGETGLNFHDARGRLRAGFSYGEIRERARALARRLLGMGLSRGDRIAAVAETDPEFVTLFFACQYAGLVPVALPISISLGNHDAYADQLRGLLGGCRPSLAVAPPEFLPFLEEAARSRPGLDTGSVADLEKLPEADVDLVPTGPDEVAYLQFTSGSTRFPRGVVITQSAVMSNLRGIVGPGLDVRSDDRCTSWLPFYHDMGLVGFLLGPLVSQRTVDYLSARDFAIRPVQWLKLISRNEGTIAFGPPIGYELCTRRLSPEDVEELDLECWRVAGVGAEMIQLEPLQRFAETLEPAGFDGRAFLPCYGLAESSLAVSFAELGRGVEAERVDADALAIRGEAVPVEEEIRRVSEIVNCGSVLPGHEVVIRDEDGTPLGPRTVGRITLRGPSVMSRYFEDRDATEDVLSEDGWLDTGDLGYRTEDGLFITGRSKDLIIVNGRNIWPQDLEHLAERQPEVRVGESSAFGVTEPDGIEKAVLVVQCRLSEEEEREDLVSRIQSEVRRSLGIHCLVELVPPRTLPKTSSGKLSRSEARQGFLERAGWAEAEAVTEGAE